MMLCSLFSFGGIWKRFSFLSITFRIAWTFDCSNSVPALLNVLFTSSSLEEQPIPARFTLLVLFPCLCWFIFFPISMLFLLFPYCFSNFLIPSPCFLMPAWAFWQSTCDLWCIHHYIFHLLPVFIYIRVFPLCFLCLIFDHALIFFTCLFLLELPYMHSWFKLLTPSFCCIKPHLRC